MDRWPGGGRSRVDLGVDLHLSREGHPGCMCTTEGADGVQSLCVRCPAAILSPIPPSGGRLLGGMRRPLVTVSTGLLRRDREHIDRARAPAHLDPIRCSCNWQSRGSFLPQAVHPTAPRLPADDIQHTSSGWCAVRSATVATVASATGQINIVCEPVVRRPTAPSIWAHTS